MNAVTSTYRYTVSVYMLCLLPVLTNFLSYQCLRLLCRISTCILLLLATLRDHTKLFCLQALPIRCTVGPILSFYSFLIYSPKLLTKHGSLSLFIQCFEVCNFRLSKGATLSRKSRTFCGTYVGPRGYGAHFSPLVRFVSYEVQFRRCLLVIYNTLCCIRQARPSGI